MECGPHAIFDAEITSVQPGEIGSVLSLLERQGGLDWLLLCDAGICCSQMMITARQAGVHGLGRLDSRSYKRPWVRLYDWPKSTVIAPISAAMSWWLE